MAQEPNDAAGLLKQHIVSLCTPPEFILASVVLKDVEDSEASRMLLVRAVLAVSSAANLTQALLHSLLRRDITDLPARRVMFGSPPPKCVSQCTMQLFSAYAHSLCPSFVCTALRPVVRSIAAATAGTFEIHPLLVDPRHLPHTVSNLTRLLRELVCHICASTVYFPVELRAICTYAAQQLTEAGISKDQQWVCIGRLVAEAWLVPALSFPKLYGVIPVALSEDARRVCAYLSEALLVLATGEESPKSPFLAMLVPTIKDCQPVLAAMLSSLAVAPPNPLEEPVVPEIDCPTDSPLRKAALPLIKVGWQQLPGVVISEKEAMHAVMVLRRHMSVNGSSLARRLRVLESCYQEAGNSELVDECAEVILFVDGGRTRTGSGTGSMIDSDSKSGQGDGAAEPASKPPRPTAKADPRPALTADTLPAFITTDANTPSVHVNGSSEFASTGSPWLSVSQRMSEGFPAAQSQLIAMLANAQAGADARLAKASARDDAKLKAKLKARYPRAAAAPTLPPLLGSPPIEGDAAASVSSATLTKMAAGLWQDVNHAVVTSKVARTPASTPQYASLPTSTHASPARNSSVERYSVGVSAGKVDGLELRVPSPAQRRARGARRGSL